MFFLVRDNRKWQLLTVELPSHFASAFKFIHRVHNCVHICVSEGKQEDRESRRKESLYLQTLLNYLSMFPSDVSVTVTPANALRGNLVTWSAPASITQWELTARDVTPFTRTDPGPGPLGTPPMSVWVSSLIPGCCHKPTGCSHLENTRGSVKFKWHSQAVRDPIKSISAPPRIHLQCILNFQYLHMHLLSLLHELVNTTIHHCWGE